MKLSCVHFYSIRYLSSFQAKTLINAGTRKRCPESILGAQLSSGEGYGFIMDKASSDSRVIQARVRGSGAPRAYSELSVESRR